MNTGRSLPVYPISAGLDYPGIGPEHAYLHDTGRAQYVPVTDDEAVEAFEYLSRTEGLSRPSRARARRRICEKASRRRWEKDKVIVVNLSGRGDKDVAAIARYRGWISMTKTRQAFADGKAFIPFLTAGDPPDITETLILEMAAQGADLIEIGIPFSDPVAEGQVIQNADERSLSAGLRQI